MNWLAKLIMYPLVLALAIGNELAAGLAHHPYTYVKLLLKRIFKGDDQNGS